MSCESSTRRRVVLSSIAVLLAVLVMGVGEVDAGGVCAGSFGVQAFGAPVVVNGFQPFAVTPTCGFGVQAFAVGQPTVFLNTVPARVNVRSRALGGRRAVFRQSTVIRQ